MINDVLLSAGVGVLLALILSVPAIVWEVRRKRHRDHPLLVDIDTFGGRKLSDRESFALGILFQLVLGLFFGLLYPFNPSFWSFAGEAYTFLSVTAYALVLYLIATGIVMPFMGMGVLGWREDKWIWLETLFTMALMVVGYILIVHWFQPSWFA